MTQQDYDREIEFIFNRFPSYQKVGGTAYKPGIGTMQRLDTLMGHPHRKFRSVHIAGTNGKGSVSHMLAAALMETPREIADFLRNVYPLEDSLHPGKEMRRTSQEFSGLSRFSQSQRLPDNEGTGMGDEMERTTQLPRGNGSSGGFLKVGLYTSPHLLDFRERIRVNGEMIGKDFVYDFILKYKEAFLRYEASFFEITTAMAFAYFAQQGVDFAVVECGLGGRLDSTNIITPVLSVITNIGLDHCEYLGFTLPEIAYEKAGIIKPGVPVVIGETGEEPGLTEPIANGEPAEEGGKNCMPDHSDECGVADGGLVGSAGRKPADQESAGPERFYSSSKENDRQASERGTGELSIKKVFLEKAREMNSPVYFASFLGEDPENRTGIGRERPGKRDTDPIINIIRINNKKAEEAVASGEREDSESFKIPETLQTEETLKALNTFATLETSADPGNIHRSCDFYKPFNLHNPHNSNNSDNSDNPDSANNPNILNIPNNPHSTDSTNNLSRPNSLNISYNPDSSVICNNPDSAESSVICDSAGSFLVCNSPDGDIYSRARKLYTLIDRQEMDLRGACQGKNIKTVSMAYSVSVLSRLPEISVAAGRGEAEEVLMRAAAGGIGRAATRTGLRGRWETLCKDPRIICDTGHNAHGFRLLGSQIVKEAEKYERLIMVFGVVADKDLDSIVRFLPDEYLNREGKRLRAYYYFVNASGSRALPAGALASRLKGYGFTGHTVCGEQEFSGSESEQGHGGGSGSVGKALDMYMKERRSGDLVFIGGSTFVVAEALEFFEKKK